MDACGRNRIEAGKQTAADQREREALVAIAIIVAARKQVVFAEVVINLGDHAVHAIPERSASREVRAAGAPRVIRGLSRDVGSRPRLAFQ